ncbi:thioredoxin family protein [Thalassotalea litorea]|uniref:Thioredoxin family protein n=1 Tax=Thalassotalea litorea TaxID=2020715 RepID=A0A5R9IGX7_9GAMM|nr:thioredoxin family protein [Thalassotalea litorea]TLU64765.1 thioredoxin family protein [Thalassotalea litorea]
MSANVYSYLKYGLLVACLFTLTACQSTSSDDIEQTYGAMEGSVLLADYPQFTLSYENYDVTEQETAALQPYAEAIKVKVFFGTWCHDSQREVPRFLKLAELLPELEYQLISLDYQKSDPDGMAEKYQVKFTPTFVVFKDGQEIGRVIERPQVSLGEDIANLAAKH